MSQQEQELDQEGQRQQDEQHHLVYQLVRSAHENRVASLTSQQQRIANVLFANGLIFGFLGASAGLFFAANIPKWPTSILYVASMCSLALGLVAAVAALWPLIDPLSVPSSQEGKTREFLPRLGHIASQPVTVLWNKMAPQPPRGLNMDDVRYFLSPDAILRDAHLSEAELHNKLSRSMVVNATYSNHLAVIQFRRAWIRAQLLFIVTGVLLLLPALICRLFVT